MAFEPTCVNEVNMMKEVEVDLCLICCSKVKDHLSQNNSQLLSSNLIVFYLLRRVLQVTGIELKKNLISCGNPVEWIRLCDKCSELTRQAEELHRKLRRIERELNCIQQLIWDKTRSSINSEADRKLVEETIDLSRTTGQVWRKIRNHVVNKCNLTSRSAPGAETLFNPFTEGDELANYLITQKATTAILPVKVPQQNHDDDDNHVNLEDNNVESTSISSSSPLKIKIELTPDLYLEEPKLTPDRLDHQKGENLLIDSLLRELNEATAEFDDKNDNDSDKKEEGRGDKLLVQDKLEEDTADWNWEPEDKDEHSEMNEEDDDEELSSSLEEIEEDLEEKCPEKGDPTNSATKAPRRKLMVNRPPRPVQKSRSTYVKKGTAKKLIRTEDGKIKCRHCDQTFASASGFNSHDREKHSKTPGAFICDICGRTFNSRDYLRKHKIQSHKLKPDGTPTVKNRKIIRTKDGKYQCLQCDQIFASSSGCTSHHLDKHSNTPGAFICDICGRAFNSQDFLRSHKTCSHRVKLDGTPIPKKAPKLERDHMCEQCGKGFTTPKQLKKHVRFVHEKRFEIRCDLCGMGWPSRNGMKKHMLALHPEEPSTKKLIEEEGLGLWKCPVIGCSVRFLKESGVKGHLKSKHGKGEEVVEGLDLGVVLEDPSLKVTCPTCGKICLNKQVFKKHMELHDNEGKAKEFICEICGVGFGRREYLKGHVDGVHLKKRKPEKKEFKCEICGKGYATRPKLRDHLELHEKEGKRDYFCDKCGHGFTLEKYLRTHKRRTNCGEEGKQARVYNRKRE